VLHISIWGIEAFFRGLSGDGTEFWAPCDGVSPPNLGVWSAADTALSTIVFPYSTLRPVVCSYRNSAIFISQINNLISFDVLSFRPLRSRLQLAKLDCGN